MMTTHHTCDMLYRFHSLITLEDYIARLQAYTRIRYRIRRVLRSPIRTGSGRKKCIRHTPTHLLINWLIVHQWCTIIIIFFWMPSLPCFPKRKKRKIKIISQPTPPRYIAGPMAWCFLSLNWNNHESRLLLIINIVIWIFFASERK